MYLCADKSGLFLNPLLNDARVCVHNHLHAGWKSVNPGVCVS